MKVITRKDTMQRQTEVSLAVSDDYFYLPTAVFVLSNMEKLQNKSYSEEHFSHKEVK